ncbi:MAG: DEAD/DEAH box helicase [Parachlamydia sp.]|nr:DEAD/DEAH box helicase [Parachlamydia sp.]
MNYLIDKALSESERALVIRIDSPGNLSAGLLRSKATGTHAKAIDFLIRQELSYQAKILGRKPSENHAFNLCHVAYPQTLEALKLLAATGKLFFGQRELVCDFYAPTEFYYQVDAGTVTGRIKAQGQDFDIRECDFLCAGPPHWFIKGIVVKFIQSDVSWTSIRDLLQGKAIDLEDAEGPKVVYLGNSREMMKQQKEPVPFLVLKDRSGAFADLWMDYGEKKIACHELGGKERMPEVEKGWERDLLETGFVKKIVGSSHYYCPMEQVAKSLAFLLEVGWKIIDAQGRQVVRQGDAQLAMTADLHVRGKIRYGSFEADVTEVVGAFNRRERFVELNNGSVGLMAPFEGLQTLSDEGEMVEGGIKLTKSRLGSILDQFENIQMDASLKDLGERLANFSGIVQALPDKTFLGELRPYQQAGVNWLAFLYEYGFHGILADDMGLGKTVQVLAFLSRLEIRDILVVVPTSLIFSWRKEIELFLPDAKVTIHHGPERKRELQPGIMLTTYATLRLDLDLFAQMDLQMLILDEAQAIKNARTQTFQTVCKLRSRFRLSLTGTPLENHLNELWAHFRFLIPDLFGEEKEFANELQAGEADQRYLNRIRKKIRPFILRRKKGEVAKDLPEKIEQVVWVVMEEGQRRVYDQFLSGIRGDLLKKVDSEGMGKCRMEVLEALLRLRQICCHPLLVSSHLEEEVLESAKMETLLEDINQVVEEGRKALVYSQFTSMLSLIGKKLKERGIAYAYLDGSTQNREEVVSRFQEDPTLHVFLISLKAGGVGLNLTSADYVFLYDPWWNEAAENQAIDRAHRIGRKETVIAKRYVMVESVEEKMMKLKEHKRSLVDALLDENVADASLTAEDLRFLLS